MHKVKRLVGQSFFSAAALIVTTSVLPIAPLVLSEGITTGSIAGPVVDPTGAAIFHAQIVATNNGQGTQRKTTSFQSTPVRCRAT